jgi:flagellar basal body-associated protein FliL
LALAKGGGSLRLLTRVLAAIAAALVLVILAGTLYALFREGGGVPGAGEAAARNGGAAESGTETAMFTGIGRLRITAGDGSGDRAVVVLSIVFPYPPGDGPFAEELTGKIPLFRRIAREYFGALAPDQLRSLDEQTAKAELLRRFNGELRLGTIGLLLFDDLMILE